MKRLVSVVATAGFAALGLFGAAPAQACDDGANTPTKYSLPNPATGGTVWYSTDDGDAGVTSDGPQGYIEVRQDGGGYEVGGRHSSGALYGQINSDDLGSICLPGG